jgi:hypothetical protein
MLSLLCPVVHDQRFDLVDVEGEIIFLASLHQGSHILPVRCLIIVRSTIVV